MKTKYFYLAALASLTLASCSSDDFIAETPPVEVENTNQVPIMFSSLKNNFTRADIKDKAAADSLGRKFVVFGYKGATADGKKTGIPGATVFDNYLVKYEENSAHKTESNTNNWEYVLPNETDVVPIKHAVDNGITQQTIKYWDYSTDQYDFIAWSTGKKDAIFEKPSTGIPAGSVLVSKITAQAATDPATGLGTAYTFEGEADDLKDCYIADLITVYKKAKEGDAQTYNVVWEGYQAPVKLRFRQLGTKVRIGIYETVPGYSVKDVKFYSAAAVALADETTGDATAQAAAKKANESAKIFTTVANGIYKEGTYTVYFPTVDAPTNADNNQAHIDFAPNTSAAQKTTVDWGGLNYTYRESGESDKGPSYLGRSSNDASFAGDPVNNYYVVYLPNQNGTNLNLRVNYTLESIDGSKETITVKGATAQVPSIYTSWKPGYAYTYLFKISDKTNGFTGPYDPEHPDDLSYQGGPAGLYPITFDAVVVNAEEDQTQETITTISNPSITTYQKGSNVVNQNEYNTSGAIFVTVNDGNQATTPDLANGKVVTLTASGNGQAAVYTLPTDKVYTEADVIDAMSMQEDEDVAPNVKGRSGLVLTKVTTAELTTSIEYGVDGNTINLAAIPTTTPGSTYSANALKFTPAAGTTYAFVYTKTAKSGTDTKIYQPVTKIYEDDPNTTDVTEQAESVNGLYRYQLVAATAPVENSHTGDVEKDKIYFDNATAASGAITAFLGQIVDNLFIKTGSTGTNADFTPAKGYAQTGTKYYYTTDNGKNYIEAHAVKFSEFKDATLSYDNAGTENKGSETVPLNNKSYYYNDSGTYKFCVIYPQRTDGLYVINPAEANMQKCVSSDVAVKGMTYFDMYEKNNGVYYAKIIKIAPAE